MFFFLFYFENSLQKYHFDVFQPQTSLKWTTLNVNSGRKCDQHEMMAFFFSFQLPLNSLQLFLLLVEFSAYFYFFPPKFFTQTQIFKIHWFGFHTFYVTNWSYFLVRIMNGSIEETNDVVLFKWKFSVT